MKRLIHVFHMKTIPMYDKTYHIKFPLLCILRLLEYIKIEDYKVEEDEMRNAAAVAIFIYVLIYAKIYPFKNIFLGLKTFMRL